jgi:hypothetical protein
MIDNIMFGESEQLIEDENDLYIKGARHLA